MRNPRGSDPRAPDIGPCLRFLVSGGKRVAGLFLRSVFIYFVCFRFLCYSVRFTVRRKGDEGTATGRQSGNG